MSALLPPPTGSSFQGRAVGDLEISGQRLEAAGVHVAVRDDGEMRIIYTDVGRCLAGRDGFTVYSARDMYTYVTLGLRERSILHSFKRHSVARPSGGTWDASIDVLATGSIDTPGEGRGRPPTGQGDSRELGLAERQ